MVRVRVGVRVRVWVRVRVRVRVRVIRFIQDKSCSHCYGHAAATTSHPYFVIVVRSKSTAGAISCVNGPTVGTISTAYKLSG